MVLCWPYSYIFNLVFENYLSQAINPLFINIRTLRIVKTLILLSFLRNDFESIFFTFFLVYKCHENAHSTKITNIVFDRYINI